MTPLALAPTALPPAPILAQALPAARKLQDAVVGTGGGGSAVSVRPGWALALTLLLQGWWVSWLAEERAVTTVSELVCCAKAVIVQYQRIQKAKFCGSVPC